MLQPFPDLPVMVCSPSGALMCPWGSCRPISSPPGGRRAHSCSHQSAKVLRVASGVSVLAGPLSSSRCVWGLPAVPLTSSTPLVGREVAGALTVSPLRYSGWGIKVLFIFEDHCKWYMYIIWFNPNSNLTIISMLRTPCLLR